MGIHWPGLDYVCGSLFDDLGARKAVLWVADADHTMRQVASRPGGAFDGLTPGDPVFGPLTVTVRTPSDPDRPAIAWLATVDTSAEHAQRRLDDAAAALSTLALLERTAAKAHMAGGVLEAIADQAAVLDTDGVVIQTNAAWTQTPVSHRRAIERSPVGTVYTEALRSQVSRPARIAADGVEAVLKGALPSFQSDYDTDVDRSERSYSLQVDPLPGGGAVVRHMDISFRKHLQRQLAHRATHDPLTGLPNRMVMNERLGQALIRASRTQSGIALLFCDVDAFKQINDSMGHAVGDKVLMSIARRLQETVRQADVVARFGGDEFVVLLEDIDDEEQAHRFAHDLQAVATKPITVDGRPLHFSVSIGICVHHGDTDPNTTAINALLNSADTAMYAAKRSGRGSIRTVRPESTTSGPVLATALESGEISLLLQPIVDFDSQQPVCFEACARLDVVGHQILSPADFLQRAEETGAIVEIGRQVLRQAVAFAAEQPVGSVSVNVSWAELAQDRYPEWVMGCLLESGLPAERLELEVLMPTSGQIGAIAALRQLREAGVGITIDAFGRQPIELAVLPDLAATGIKVDRALVAAMTNNARHARLVRGLVQLTHRLGLVSTAEGIETSEQSATARALGFERGQGFHFGLPVPPADLPLG